jgi:hypothetical protein
MVPSAKFGSANPERLMIINAHFRIQLVGPLARMVEDKIGGCTSKGVAYWSCVRRCHRYDMPYHVTIHDMIAGGSRELVDLVHGCIARREEKTLEQAPF